MANKKRRKKSAVKQKHEELLQKKKKGSKITDKQKELIFRSQNQNKFKQAADTHHGRIETGSMRKGDR